VTPLPLMTNNEIEEKLSYLAKLMALHGEADTMVKAIANSAFQVDRQSVDLSKLSLSNLHNLSGLNKSTIKLVTEIIETGKLALLDNLLSKTPKGVQQLLQIRGLGPKKCITVWKEMGIESPTELANACNENRLIAYKGFSATSQASLLDATNFYLQSLGKFLYADAELLIENLKLALENLVGENYVFITGEFIRQEQIISNFEFVINLPAEQLLEILESNSEFSNITFNEMDEINLHFHNAPCKIYTCEADNAMEQLFFTIGPKEFTDKFMEQYPEIDYSITNQLNDRNIFEQAGIQYIPPFIRNNINSIDTNTTYENIIQLKDIKGIIHNHSTYSDGAHTLEQMAMACIKMKMEYLVISDHSEYATYARGLTHHQIIKQHQEIEMLNKKLAPFKIFKSIECDILPNGDLDYNPEILASFEIIVASIHSVFNMTESQAMARLEKAIQNPYTNIIGHPTGRLLLGREGYPVDMPQLINLCSRYNVVVELNANPRRLDIDWQYIEYAKTKNVLISINPDAHSINGIQDIKYGVLIAQKAALQANQNLSSFSLLQMEEFILAQHKKRQTNS
jgi:DNA polymerase (family X)